jgi:uncharacterized protein YbjT (DUF2867 family)
MLAQSKAMVFGATGFTGREVVRELIECKVPAIAHVRPDSGRLEEWRKRFIEMGAEVDTTAWHLEEMADSLARVKPEIIFLCLGTTRSRIKQVAISGKDPKTQDYEAVDYGLTAMVLEATIKAGIKPRLVYISAAGTGPSGMMEYARARYKTEQAVITSGLPYAIARPSFIIGPDRDDKRTREIMGARLIDGLLVIPWLIGLGKFRARFHSTSNKVLAKALVRIALDPSSENKIFESEKLR